MPTSRRPADCLRRHMQLGAQILKFGGIKRPDYYWGLCFTAEEPNVVVNMTKSGSPPAVTLEYSTDGREWQIFDANNGTTPVTLKKTGSLVYFRAGSGGNRTISGGTQYWSYRRFSISGRCAASGNIMSIFNAEDETNTTLSDPYAVAYLFYDNPSLTAAPDLPATNITGNCYSNMFARCSSLTSAPELPATTLAGNCYSNMFAGCSSLTSAPELPATTLANSCYYCMFTGCSALTASPELPASTISNTCYYRMFAECSSLASAGAIAATSARTSCMQQMFENCSSLVVAPNLNITTIEANYAQRCCQQMFKGCTSLTTPPVLPATVAAAYCYMEMFSGCTSLTSAPALPATTVYHDCYHSMFEGCTSLSSYGSGLPATSLLSNSMNCYQGMFKGCTSLQTTIGISATNSVENAFASMYEGCTGLKTAAVPGTSTATSSHASMFSGCTGLQTVTQFSPTNLAGANACERMFYGCTALTGVSLNTIATASIASCKEMFSGCTSLTSTPQFTVSVAQESAFEGMFKNCTGLSAAPSLPATTIRNSCYKEMFKGCTGLSTPPPSLPATELAESCYEGMFSGCTNLTAAPALPSLAPCTDSYRDMFYGCTGISSIRTSMLYFDDCCSGWLGGVAASGAFHCASALGTNASIERGGGYCPSGWTVTNDVVVNLSNPLKFTANIANSTVAMTSVGGRVIDLAYSTNNGEKWHHFVAGETSVTLSNINDTVLFAGSSVATATSSSAYCSFSIGASISASGNAMSLIGYGNLTSYAFSGLFENCTSLTSAPDLPATSLATYCYYRMFSGCTALTAAPALPATTLANSCYADMFNGCTSLTAAPALPATTIAQSCYSSMFSGCTSLVAAPALPATTMYQSCYRYMFEGCSSLVQAPNLPATSLGSQRYCYQYMFSDCTSLERTGKIALQTATGSGALTYMFSGCSNLKYIELTGMTAWSTRMTSWVDGVAAHGLFVCPAALGTESTITRGVSKCPTGWRVNNYWGLTFEAMEAGASIGMAKAGTPPAVTLEYSTDGSAWNTYDADVGTAISLPNVGDFVCFRAGSSGNTAFASSGSACRNFVMRDGKVSASGNIMSILDGANANNVTISDAYALCSLFYECSNLTYAPLLPATTLSTYCYYYMFYGCTSLTTAPALPAETLTNNCYSAMFRNCTSLTTAPALPATTLAASCYGSMFSGCTALTTAPELPATTLAGSCYSNMFSGCTALTTAPELPATTLAASCYITMFSGCTALTTAPDLPATTANALLFVYYRMFYNCSGLERTGRIAIETATGISALAQIFYGCSNLKYIELSGMTAWSTRMASWVNGVSATGTFKCPAALGTDETITRGVNNCPTGWTVVNI